MAKLMIKQVEARAESWVERFHARPSLSRLVESSEAYDRTLDRLAVRVDERRVDVHAQPLRVELEGPKPDSGERRGDRVERSQREGQRGGR